MALTRATRAKLVWALELALGLELYACAVLALHSRGLRATPILAAPGVVIPALVIPPVFYALVGLVSVRPFSVMRVGIAAGAMCAVHALLVMATGALFVIPDLVDYGAAVAFALWGSPAVTMLQLTAAPLVLARLRPLIVARPAPGGTAVRRADVQTMGTASVAVREHVPPTPALFREHAAAAQRPTVVTRHAAAVALAPTVKTSVATPSRPASIVREPAAQTPAQRAPTASSSAATPPATNTPVVRINATASPLEWPDRRASVEPVDPRVRVAFSRIADQLPIEMFARGAKGLSDMLRPGVSLFVPRSLLLPHLAEGVAPVKWEIVADQFPRDELLLTNAEIAKRLPNGSLRLPLDEVMPQIPAELLTLSKRSAVVPRTDELPPPVQFHVPPSPITAAVEILETPKFHVQELAVLVDDAPKPVVAEPGEAELEATEPEATEPEATEPEVAEPEVAEVAGPEAMEQGVDVAGMEVADVAEAEVVLATAEPATPEPLAPVLAAPALPVPPVMPTLVVSAPAKPLAEPEAPKHVSAVVLQAPEHEPLRPVQAAPPCPG